MIRGDYKVQSIRSLGRIDCILIRVSVPAPTWLLALGSTLGIALVCIFRFEWLTWGRVVSLILVASLIVILSVFLRAQVLAATLGFLLPIHVAQGIDPVVVDIARLLILTAFLIKSRKEARRFSPLQLGLAAVAAGILALSLMPNRQDFVGLQLALALLQASLIAVCVMPTYIAEFIRGFVLGCAMSALAVVIEATSGVALGGGFQGSVAFAGLGNASTTTGPAIALAIYLLLKWRCIWSKSAFVPVMLLLVGGLMASGSRVGLLLGFIGFVGWAIEERLNVKAWIFSILAILAILGASFALRAASVVRLAAQTSSPDNRVLSTDYSTGRTHAAVEGIKVVQQDWLLGIGAGEADARGIHSAFLWFPSAFGVLGGVGVCFILGLMWLEGMSLVLLVMILCLSIFEPVGYLAGGSLLPILLVSGTRWQRVLQPLEKA